jgi:hypothetical protein
MVSPPVLIVFRLAPELSKYRFFIALSLILFLVSPLARIARSDSLQYCESCRLRVGGSPDLRLEDFSMPGDF